MRKEKIQESVDNIRESANEIEEEIKDKRVATRGDPVVRFMD